LTGAQLAFLLFPAAAIKSASDGRGVKRPEASVVGASSMTTEIGSS